MFEQLNLQEDVFDVLDARRDEGETITFREFFADEFSDIPGDPMTLVDMFMAENGLDDLTEKTFAELMDFDKDKRFQAFFPELILTPFIEGFRAAFSPEDLLAFSIEAGNKDTLTLPYFKLREGVKKTVGEDLEVTPGVQFKEDFVEFGDKRTKLRKYGKQLNFTYETVEDTPFKFMVPYIQGLGAALAIDKIQWLLKAIVEGDGALDRDDKLIANPIAEVGVKDKTKGIQWRDILKVAVRMTLRGRAPNEMLCEEEQFVETSILPEYFQRYQGKPLSTLKKKAKISTPENLWPAPAGVGVSKMIIIAKQFCTGEFKKKGLRVEKDKLITKQLHRMVVSMRSSYINVFDDARVLLNGTKNLTEQPFPAWFEILLPKG